ncbi:hypothetical protein [Streptacidiphilus cavernicola]|uniref:Uncharacterized protein n=1 Tax=Streptacidiphilus cavernicola TaxID=3342716 RepID=A0ABV6VXV1_9ACTN
MSLTTALYCDRCKDSTFVADPSLFRGDLPIYQETEIVLREAINAGWLARDSTYPGITWGEAVCPSCRAAGLGLQWKKPEEV